MVTEVQTLRQQLKEVTSRNEENEKRVQELE